MEHCYSTMSYKNQKYLAFYFVFFIQKKPSTIFILDGWKGQNPSKTFRFEASFVENLQKRQKWKCFGTTYKMSNKNKNILSEDIR